MESLSSRLQAVNPYTEVLVRGVQAHADQIDETLSTYAQGWTLDRMPAVDRAILRVGRGTAVGMCRKPWPCPKRSCWLTNCPPTTPGSTSTGCWRGYATSEAADGSGIASAWCPRWDSNPHCQDFEAL